MASSVSPPGASAAASSNVSRSSSRGSVKSHTLVPPFPENAAVNGKLIEVSAEIAELMSSMPRPGSGISRHSSGASFNNEPFRRRESRESDTAVPAAPIVEESCIPLPLAAPLLQQLTQYTIDWALLHGIVVNFADRSKSNLQHAPFSMLPTPFPSLAFSEALNCQRHFNKLFLRFRSDPDFLVSVLTPIAEKDEFTSKLLRIFRAVETEGVLQTTSLSLHRSDYVLHLPTAATFPTLRLASIQTMSVSFAAYGTLLSDMHRHVLSRFALATAQPAAVPPNPSLSNIVELMARAVACYCSMFSMAASSASVLIVQTSVDDASGLESRTIEHLLWDKFHISVVRKTFAEVYAESEYKPDRSLHLADREIGLVFFRSGSRPSDYTSGSDWSARLQLERCRAIKCPSIADQLSGHRRIQHLLTRAEVLDAWTEDTGMAEDVRRVFDGIHGLGRGEAEAAIKLISEAPDEFILQSSLGVAGSQLVGADLVDRLVALTDEELSFHALIERARPPMYKNYCVQNNHISLGNVVSELSVFGGVLADRSKVIHSTVLGHVLRTKMTDEDGGMSAGLTVLDSPYLI